MRKSVALTVQLTAIMALLLFTAHSSTGAQNLITVQPPKSSPEAEPSGERPATYSEAQAERGGRAYRRYCLNCHGRNLNDGEFGGPPLRGSSFEENFGDLPVSVLYGFIAAAMPPDNPGGISKGERTAIVAYLLSRNGYPEGAPLPTDTDELDNVILEK